MGKLNAGAAKASITPTENLRLAGYSATENVLLMPFRHRIAEGVHDDIYARAFALNDGARTIAFVVVDLIGFFQSDVAEVRAIVGSKLGLEGLDVVVASTHNHTAPDTWGAYGGIPKRYRAFLRERTAQAVITAVESMAPAAVGFATVRVPEMVQNIRHPDAGPVDEEATLLALRAQGGEPIGVAVNFAGHADVLGGRNRQITADFPGVTCGALEEGWDGTAVFLSGALGDMYPRQAVADPDDTKGLRTFEEAENLGRAIAAPVLAALPQVKFRDEATITVEKATVDLPIEMFVVRLAHLLGFVPKRRLYGGKVRAETWRIDIDGAQMVTVPGQALVSIGLELKARMSAQHKFVLCLANDELAYIVPPDEWDPSLDREEERFTLGRGTWPLLREAIPLTPPAAGQPS